MGELQFTMTTGSVSALDRAVTTAEYSSAINMFQFDAAINEGNSGGPVYNANGQVLGIATAKYSANSSATSVEGLGFAIPANDAKSIAKDLMATGTKSHFFSRFSAGTLVPRVMVSPDSALISGRGR